MEDTYMNHGSCSWCEMDMGLHPDVKNRKRIFTPAFAGLSTEQDHEGLMFEVHEEAALRHPKPFLYGILADVQRVPDYLPSCTSMSLIEDSDTLLRFRCTVRGLGTLEIETLFEKNLLTMNLVSGLPVRIQARWRIQSLDGGSSRVFFDAEADIPAGMRFWARRRALETALKGALTQLQKRADALA